MDLIAAIKNLGYTIEEVPNQELDLIPPGQTIKKRIMYGNNTLYLIGKEKVKDQAEAEELVKQGRVIKTTGMEILNAYYNFTEEQICQRVNHYGLQTKKYLEIVEKTIGLIDVQTADEFEELTEEEKKPFALNTSDLIIGKTKNGQYCAEFGYRSDIDDYTVVKYYFNHRPSMNQINMAYDIQDIRIKFATMAVEEVYTCWECGNKVHWIDAYTNFQDRKKGLETRCCCE